MACSKNVSGTLTGSLNPGRTCQNSTLRVRQTGTVSGLVTCVDDLIVRNQLITNTQTGGTLTLNGSGSRNPTYEAALCVKTGARFDGLTQHKKLRVLEDSQFGGPATLPSIFGPTVVTTDPAGPGSAGPLLTVNGTGNFTEVQAFAANVGILNSDSLSVAGYAVGPLATQEIILLLSDRLCVVTATLGLQTLQTLGIAVDTNKVLTTLFWQGAGATASGAKAMVTGVVAPASTVAPAKVVVSPIYGGGSAHDTITIHSVSGSAGLVTLTVPGANLPPSNPLLFAGYQDYADTPPAGTPVIIAYTDSVIGTILFAEGVISDPCAQLYAQYTTLQVTLTTNLLGLSNGANGGVIIDYRGVILGMLQYGNNLSAASTSVFYRTVGGIKGRYINYYLKQTDATMPGVRLPIPTGTYAQCRNITPVGRLVGAPPGGVTINSDGSVGVPADQIIKLSGVGTDPITFQLGNLSQNNPSFTDSLLVLKDLGEIQAQATDAALGGGPTTITGTVNFYVGNEGGTRSCQPLTPANTWENGCPNSLSYTPTTGLPSTYTYTQFTLLTKTPGTNYFIDLDASTPAQKITIANMTQLTNLSNAGTFIALTHGNESYISGPLHTGMFYVSGDPVSVVGFLTQTGSPYAAMWRNDPVHVYVDPYVLNPPPPNSADAKVLTVFGARGNASTQSFFTPPSAQDAGRIEISSAGTSAAVTIKVYQNKSPSTIPVTVNSLLPGYAYNTWYYITNVSSPGNKSLGLQGSDVVTKAYYNLGSASTFSIGLSSASSPAIITGYSLV